MDTYDILVSTGVDPRLIAHCIAGLQILSSEIFTSGACPGTDYTSGILDPAGAFPAPSICIDRHFLMTERHTSGSHPATHPLPSCTLSILIPVTLLLLLYPPPPPTATKHDTNFSPASCACRRSEILFTPPIRET